MFGMPSCKEVSRLVSESMDNKKLPLRKRFGLWMHLHMCDVCKGFVAQLKAIRKAAGQLGTADDPASSDATLSAEARERIQRAMRDSGTS